MSPLLAPILAQLLTISVGDRTEGRYQKVDDKRWELATTPGIGLGLQVRRYDFFVGYSPSLIVTPLEKKPRDTLLFHDLGASGGYRWQRTSLRLGSTLRFGEVNFRSALLQNLAGSPTLLPPDGTGGATDPGLAPDPDAVPDAPDVPTPGAGVGGGLPAGQSQRSYLNRVVEHIESITTLSLSHTPTRRLSLGSYLSYGITGAMNEADRVEYPLTRGWTLGGSAYYTRPYGARDAFTTTALGQIGWSGGRDQVTLLQVDEAWRHSLRPETKTTLGVGLSVTRTATEDGLVAVSIFPTFVAGIDDTELLWGGQLYAALNTYSNPVLDQLRATVDPRIGASAYLSWSRGAFSASVTASGAISVAPAGNDGGAADGYSGAATMSYEVTPGLTLDTGARGAAQRLPGTTANPNDDVDPFVVPPSWAVFAGVTVGHAFSLKLGH